MKSEKVKQANPSGLKKVQLRVIESVDAQTSQEVKVIQMWMNNRLRLQFLGSDTLDIRSTRSQDLGRLIVRDVRDIGIVTGSTLSCVWTICIAREGKDFTFQTEMVKSRPFGRRRPIKRSNSVFFNTTRPNL